MSDTRRSRKVARAKAELERVDKELEALQRRRKDSPELPALMARAKARYGRFQPAVAVADRGYDAANNHQYLRRRRRLGSHCLRGVKPITIHALMSTLRLAGYRPGQGASRPAGGYAPDGKERGLTPDCPAMPP